jgi:hypothetical protein
MYVAAVWNSGVGQVMAASAHPAGKYRVGASPIGDSGYHTW